MTLQVVFLNPPSRNIEYPSSSIAAVTALVDRLGVGYRVIDVNARWKDDLISVRGLDELLHEEIPRLAASLAGSPQAVVSLHSMQKTLNVLRDSLGFAAVLTTKQSMQRGMHRDVFRRDDAFGRVEALSAVLRMLHVYVDLAFGAILQRLCSPRDGVVGRLIDALMQEVEDCDPTWVGISCMSVQRLASLVLADQVKRRIGSLTVLGGADPTHFPRSYLNGKPGVDCVFIGPARTPASLTFLETRPRTHRRIYESSTEVRNDGHVYVSPPSLTFSNIDLGKYLVSALPVRTSAGCSWRRCDFCDHWHHSPHYVRYDPDEVIRQMQTLAEQHGIHLFHFADDELEAQHGCEVFRRLERCVPHARIMTYARLDKMMTKSVLEKWYAGGARVIEWGLETGSDRLLYDMGKGIRLRSASRILREARECGLVNKVMMFHNHPRETIDDVRKSVGFLRRMEKKDYIRLFFPIGTMLELRANTALYRLSKSKKVFGKVWWPEGDFPARAIYGVHTETYRTKLRLLNAFLEEMDIRRREKSAVGTDDETVLVDLVLGHLMEVGSASLVRSRRVC